MNIRKFIGGSSLLIAAWLGATFIQKVPTHRYPQLGKDHKSPTTMVENTRQAYVAQKSAAASEVHAH